MKYNNANSPESYLEAIPEERKLQLEKIRNIILSSAPKAKEEYEYGMLNYPLQDHLFSLASQKNYMALYVGDFELVKRYTPQLGKVSVGKSCIRFKNIDDIDLAAIQALIEESYEKRINKLDL